jgi:5-methylcytosine-specific restriction endonuclease McrA
MRRRKRLRRLGARKLRELEAAGAARTLVLWRARGVCERCGTLSRYRPLHPHHRLPRSRGGKDLLDNLSAVCFDCHRWIHDHPEKAKAEGWTR